jgi:hypothetical protein
MPDGRARSLPKTAVRPARIVAVRQTAVIWNAALSGNMSLVPLPDSVIFAFAFNSDASKLAAHVWPDQFGGFRFVLLGGYATGAQSTMLLMGRFPKGRNVALTTAFNFYEPSASYRGICLAECIVRDFRGEPHMSSATDVTATSATSTIVGYDGLGGIGIFGHNVDTGAAGPAYSSTTSPERVTTVSSGGTGLLTLTNEPHRFTPWSSTVTATRSPSVAWACASALVR